MAKKPSKGKAEAAPAAEGEAASGAAQPRWTKRKLIILGGGAAGVLLVGGGVAFSLGLFGRPAAPPPAAAAGAPGGAVAPAGATAQPGGASTGAPQASGRVTSHFLDMPDMTVNLSGGQRPQFLRVRLALELPDQQTAAQIQPLMPRVQDSFQTFLRELRTSDLEGSAGMHRLREELTRRINLVVQPARVDAVLFKELLVQ